MPQQSKKWKHFPYLSKHGKYPWYCTKARQEGKLTSRQINTLMRSIKVFEWNALNPAKQHLMFSSEKEFDESINDAHKRMIKLTDSLGPDGEKNTSKNGIKYMTPIEIWYKQNRNTQKEIEAKSSIKESQYSRSSKGIGRSLISHQKDPKAFCLLGSFFLLCCAYEEFSTYNIWRPHPRCHQYRYYDTCFWHYARILPDVALERKYPWTEHFSHPRDDDQSRYSYILSLCIL